MSSIEFELLFIFLLHIRKVLFTPLKIELKYQKGIPANGSPSKKIEVKLSFYCYILSKLVQIFACHSIICLTSVTAILAHWLHLQKYIP